MQEVQSRPVSHLKHFLNGIFGGSLSRLLKEFSLSAISWLSANDFSLSAISLVSTNDFSLSVSSLVSTNDVSLSVIPSLWAKSWRLILVEELLLMLKEDC